MYIDIKYFFSKKNINKNLCWSNVWCTCNISNTRECFIGISKHWEESWEYDVQQSIFDEIRNVWIADETLHVSRVFDTSSQSKQKLRVNGKVKWSKSMLIKIG